MRRTILTLVLALTLNTIGCTPVERQAYNTVVGAKAFLATVKSQHPECVTGSTASVCMDIAKATAAKDFLIDAAEVYCASTDFDQKGGVCSPPAKGTPASDQAIAKLKAAIASYIQTATDLKGVL